MHPFIIIIVIALYLIAPIICRNIALKKERSPILWAFLGLLFGFFAVLIIECLPNLKSQKENYTIEDLKKLEALLDNGFITKEEFDEKKKQMFNL